VNEIIVPLAQQTSTCAEGIGEVAAAVGDRAKEAVSLPATSRLDRRTIRRRRGLRSRLASAWSATWRAAAHRPTAGRRRDHHQIARTFASQLTFATHVQLGFSVGLLSTKVLSPPGASFSSGTPWQIWLRGIFDGRYFFRPREDLQPPR
jgi:hypothetical protein